MPSEITRASRLRGPPRSLPAATRQPSGILRCCLTQLRFQPSGPSVREICNQASNPSLRPTYREVTACGGTFPDTVTYLHGLHTPICPVSFRETRSPQAFHLPEDGTLFRIAGFPAPGSDTSAPSPSPRPCGCYQLAFVTPGIRPFEAISRNWIRLIPNRRM